MDSAAASADGGAFLEFVDYAISMLSSSSSGGNGDESPGAGPAPARPPWGWAVAQVLKSCCAYSSGVTAAILLSDLFQVRHFYLNSNYISRMQLFLQAVTVSICALCSLLESNLF
jgi:hypothetical protein